MKNLFVCCFLASLLISNQLYGINPTVDWNNAGATLPSVDTVIEDVSSVEDLNTALANRNPDIITKIELTADIFNFGNTTLQLDSNVIIYGQGPSSTKLLFNVGDESSAKTCIKITGSNIEPDIHIDSNCPECINFGSTYLVLEDASSISAGDYINFYTDNTDNWGRDTDPSDNTFIGQMLKVTSKNGNTIYLDDALHLDFRNYPNENANWNTLNPRIRKFRPAHDVGIENVYIGPIDESTSKNGSSIYICWAANCWISNIESYMPKFYGVTCGKSMNITIEGSYFHKGNVYYGGGQAYGILLSSSSTHCLVENNIFYWLRHAICFAGGANGNVAGYNFSFRSVFAMDEYPTVTLTDLPCSDYFFHGHYPFANLVEGNIGHYIQFENTWGSNGPYNMVFKNSTLHHDESFGIQINPGHPYQNVIGNYVTAKFSYIALQGSDDASQKFDMLCDTVYHFHNYDDCEVWDPDFYDWVWEWARGRNKWYNKGSNDDLPTSYYRSTEPPGWPQDGSWNLFSAIDDLGEKQSAYNTWKSGNYDVETCKYVKLQNIEESTDNLFAEGKFSLMRKNHSVWYDSIPSDGEVRLEVNENIVDVKALQEYIQNDKHHKWDDIREKFLLQSNDHDIVAGNIIKAKYLNQHTASATWTEPVKVYLKDPWHVSDPDFLTQPETYREISSGVSFDVFLEEGGEVNNLQYPYYSARAPKFYATDNAIYEFSHWSSPNGKATFDPNNADNYAGCGVRFDQDGAVVKPNYVAVNNQTNYTATIPSNETLTIPAGASISFAEGFTLDVKGALTVDGPAAIPVILTSTGKESGFASGGYGYLVTDAPAEKLTA